MESKGIESVVAEAADPAPTATVEAQPETVTTQEVAASTSEKKQQQQQTPPPPPSQTSQSNMGIPVQCNQFPGGSNHPSRNGSPVLMRPASAMSTTSTASYLTAGTANTAVTSNPHHAGAIPRYNAGNPMYARGQHPGQYPPAPPHGQYHHGGGLTRPTGRYPMPPRGPMGPVAGGGHPLRPVPTRMGGGGGFPPQRQGYPQQQQHYGHGSSPFPPHYQEYHHQQVQYHPQHPQDAYVHEQTSILPPPPPPPSGKQQGENPEQQTNDDGSTTTATQEGGVKEEPPAMDDSAASPEQQQENTAPGNPEAQDKMQPQGSHGPHASIAPMNNTAGPHSSSMHYGGGGNPREQQQQQYYQQSYQHSQQYHNHHQAHAAYGGYGHQQQGMRYGGCYHYNEGPGGISPPPHYQQQQQHYHHQQYHPHNDYAAMGPYGGHPHHHQGHYGMHPQEQHYAPHSGMPPMHHHQGSFQLPHYNAGARNPGSRRGSLEASPETTVDDPMLSRSPSPPPRPPSNAPDEANEASGDASMAGTDAGSVGTSKSKATALGEREQNTNGDGGSVAPSNPPTKAPGKKEDATADAASILLALGMQAQKGGSENENLPQSVQGSRSMDDASEMTHPDLTSDPSNDSMEQSQASSRIMDSEFPCPIPAKYPTRLCLPYDGAKLNSLHCFLRSELLEIFVVKKGANKSPTHSPHSSVGRVGLRCVHCAMVKRDRDNNDEAPMAVFYPKSVAEIYRLVTSWQRCHLRKCRNLPPAVRAKWQELRETDKSRGKTHYWVTSAKEIGLRDCQSRAGGIRFAPDLDASTLPPQTRIVDDDMPPMESTTVVPKNHVSGDPPGTRV